ncbi:MAG: flagellar biosynthetic protein FliO [Terriglobales bacterium]
MALSTPTLHAWDLKRWLTRPHGRRQRRLRLIETLALGERRFVGLLAVDGRELLIGATPHSLTLLDDLSAAALDDFVPAAAHSGREVQ